MSGFNVFLGGFQVIKTNLPTEKRLEGPFMSKNLSYNMYWE